MSYRISVDTGGTFTDVVVADERGHLRIGKALTTPRARLRGHPQRARADRRPSSGSRVEELLAQTEVFTYGTTRATNAIVEGKTARTAFFTTEGFPDILLAARGRQARPVQADPLPAALRAALPHVRDRASASTPRATASSPLDEAVGRCARSRRRGRCGAEAIAVCLLWSIVNPAHELRVGELIAEHWPDVPYTLSHQLNPIIREYRRASSTAIDASLKPLMQEYLSTMERDLRAGRFPRASVHRDLVRRLLAAGGVVERPIYSVGSGPSMAPVAALTYARAELATRPDELIVCDTGGTTFDVGLVSGGRDQLHGRDLARRALDRPHHRHPLGRREVDRRRRRLDRLDRPGRAAPRRAAERGRRPGAGLLRARRHGARPSPTPRSCSARSTPTTSSADGCTLDADAARACDRARPSPSRSA